MLTKLKVALQGTTYEDLFDGGQGYWVAIPTEIATNIWKALKPEDLPKTAVAPPERSTETYYPWGGPGEYALTGRKIVHAAAKKALERGLT